MLPVRPFQYQARNTGFFFFASYGMRLKITLRSLKRGTGMSVLERVTFLLDKVLSVACRLARVDDTRRKPNGRRDRAAFD